MLKAQIKKSHIIEEVANIHKIQFKKNNELIAKLRQRVYPVVAKPKVTGQSMLLQYLFKAVEKVRSRIFLRVLKSRKLSSKGRACPFLSDMSRLSKYNGKSLKIRLGDFTATDKRDVIAQFFSNEEVLKVVKRIVRDEAVKEVSESEAKFNASSPKSSDSAMMNKSDMAENIFAASPVYSQLLIQLKTQLRNKRRQNMCRNAVNKSASPRSVLTLNKVPAVPKNQRSKINNSMFEISLYH
eukprot:TRINITY_DN13500_c0_g3_i2.p1 TRINITY_DN13500_c0_g3~~TRINITY_DN13500_c0_g3_i2.p1  ORF type:complete len:240 (+),score=35.30 TRINITY_DN13500_c0_g3_i2:202-921(+)